MIRRSITYALHGRPSQLHALKDMHEEEEGPAQGDPLGALRTELGSGTVDN